MCIFGRRQQPAVQAPVEPPAEPRSPTDPSARRRRRRQPGQLTNPADTNVTGPVGLLGQPVLRRLGTTLG